MTLSKAEEDAEEETLLLLQQRAEDEANKAKADAEALLKRETGEATAGLDDGSKSAMQDDDDDDDDDEDDDDDDDDEEEQVQEMKPDDSNGVIVVDAGGPMTPSRRRRGRGGRRSSKRHGRGSTGASAKGANIPSVFGYHVRHRQEAMSLCTNVIPAALGPWVCGIDFCSRCGSMGDRPDLLCCA